MPQSIASASLCRYMCAPGRHGIVDINVHGSVTYPRCYWFKHEGTPVAVHEMLIRDTEIAILLMASVEWAWVQYCAV